MEYFTTCEIHDELEPNIFEDNIDKLVNFLFQNTKIKTISYKSCNEIDIRHTRNIERNMILKK